MSPRIIVVDENEHGRNTKFKDTTTGTVMNRDDLVRKIENGQYPNYHIRDINGVKTPVSNPDESDNNNLG